jgi:hypothetical protein
LLFQRLLRIKRILKRFQELEEQPLKPPGAPAKIDPSNIPMSSTPELSNLKHNSAIISTSRSIFEEIEKASKTRKKEKSKE